MKTFVVLCALVALAHGASLNRIKGGDTATDGQFPHMAAIRSPNIYSCGAAIISRRTLVTSAHCQVNPGVTVAVVGTIHLDDYMLKRYRIAASLKHENFLRNNLEYDIALIILDEDLEFNDLVAPLPLAKFAPAAGERLTVSGWGRNASSLYTLDLQWLQTSVIGRSECAAMSGVADLRGRICTFEGVGKGMCSEDTGSPLINGRNELVGITSPTDHCGRGKPDIFTDVSYHREWIENHMV